MRKGTLILLVLFSPLNDAPYGNKEVVNKICQINEQMYEMFICSANLESQNIQAVYIKNKRMQNSQ